MTPPRALRVLGLFHGRTHQLLIPMSFSYAMPLSHSALAHSGLLQFVPQRCVVHARCRFCPAVRKRCSNPPVIVHDRVLTVTDCVVTVRDKKRPN